MEISNTTELSFNQKNLIVSVIKCILKARNAADKYRNEGMQGIANNQIDVLRGKFENKPSTWRPNVLTATCDHIYMQGSTLTVVRRILASEKLPRTTKF